MHWTTVLLYIPFHGVILLTAKYDLKCTPEFRVYMTRVIQLKRCGCQATLSAFHKSPEFTLRISVLNFTLVLPFSTMTPIQSAITEDGCWLITLSGRSGFTYQFNGVQLYPSFTSVYLVPGPLYCPAVHPFPPVGNQKLFC